MTNQSLGSPHSRPLLKQIQHRQLSAKLCWCCAARILRGLLSNLKHVDSVTPPSCLKRSNPSEKRKDAIKAAKVLWKNQASRSGAGWSAFHPRTSLETSKWESKVSQVLSQKLRPCPKVAGTWNFLCQSTAKVTSVDCMWWLNKSNCPTMSVHSNKWAMAPGSIREVWMRTAIKKSHLMARKSTAEGRVWHSTSKPAPHVGMHGSIEEDSTMRSN